MGFQIGNHRVRNDRSTLLFVNAKSVGDDYFVWLFFKDEKLLNTLKVFKFSRREVFASFANFRPKNCKIKSPRDFTKALIRIIKRSFYKTDRNLCTTDGVSFKEIPL